MDTQRSEDVVAESKMHPIPPSDQTAPSTKMAGDAGSTNVNGNANAFAENKLVSSAPVLDHPSTSSPSALANTTSFAVNGTSHHEELVNGNQTATSPPTSYSPVNTAPEPSSQPQPHEETQPTSEDLTSFSVPPVPPVPSASDFPPSGAIQIETHAELAPPSVTEPEPLEESTTVVSEPPVPEVPAPVDMPDAAEATVPHITPVEGPPPSAQAFEPETSDLRQSGEPMSIEEAKDIREENHKADLVADPELAQGLAADTTDPITRSLPQEPQAEPQPSEPADDKMDVAMGEEVNQTAADLPHRPQGSAPEDVGAESVSEPMPASDPTPPINDAQVDQEMPDVPAASVKVAREREDDTQEEERVAKRSRTDEADPSPAEFKVPNIPPPRATENGAMDESAGAGTSTPLNAPRQKHLLKAIQTIKRNKDGQWFATPVDPVKLNIPTYFDIIKNPMDLGTIEKKLKGASYGSLEEVIHDFDLIVFNSTTFNGPEHAVTKSGQKIKASFDDYVAKLPPADAVVPSSAEKKAQKVAAQASTKVTTSNRRESRSGQPNPRSPATNAGSPSTQTFALNPEGVPLIRRDSMAADGRPKREIHPPRNRGLDYGASKPKKKKYAWELKFCQHVLDELMKPKYFAIASPFYTPVDPVALNIPTYHKVIKKPMDLGTIGTKLKHGQYENAKEFEADIRLVFANCYKFNTDGDYVYNLGKSLEAEFDREWERKKKWISDNAPNSNPQSQGSSPEPDDDAEDDDDDDDDDGDDDGDNQLTILQKQIAAMSKQVEMIQKKKASPPVKKEKVKKEKVKKEKKPNIPALASKKKGPGKSGKPEKVPIVTYDQKKLISDRINDLSEAQMGQALRIIRENVPHLRDVNEEEIELDIDELPDAVLWRLLQFVRGNMKQGAEDEAVRRRPAAANHGPPLKPKKNKPMGKHEQEAQISSIQEKLAKFENAGADDGPNASEYSRPRSQTALSGATAVRSIEQGDSSSDDDGSDESEEE